ncbi:MAG: alpha/beta fold hydrolase [Synechococcales cyanobacterium]
MLTADRPVGRLTPRLTWIWRDQTIAYQQYGDQGSPVLLIHGFGAHSDHWRHTWPDLARSHRVYALDLLGFGQSDKPQPNQPLPYTFSTWGELGRDFIQQVIGEPAFVVGNSIGCVVALQMAVLGAEWVRGITMINCSLRLMHERHLAQAGWVQRWGTPLVQAVLGWPPLGSLFFRQIAQPQALRSILRQAYVRDQAVSDELIELLLAPARSPGAVEVFLAFIGYSQGPLPEDLLPLVSCPVLILWGERDPWEPIDLGRQLADYPCVEDFIPLPGVGHCPQDEAPELVNPVLEQWLERHAAGVPKTP